MTSVLLIEIQDFRFVPFASVDVVGFFLVQMYAFSWTQHAFAFDTLESYR